MGKLPDKVNKLEDVALGAYNGKIYFAGGSEICEKVARSVKNSVKLRKYMGGQSKDWLSFYWSFHGV